MMYTVKIENCPPQLKDAILSMAPVFGAKGYAKEDENVPMPSRDWSGVKLEDIATELNLTGTKREAFLKEAQTCINDKQIIPFVRTLRYCGNLGLKEAKSLADRYTHYQSPVWEDQ